MSSLPPGVTGAIRIALEANLRYYHEISPRDLPLCDLYVDVVQALKSVYEASPEIAVSLVAHALRNVSTPDVMIERAVPLQDAAECLRHSMTRDVGGEWTYEQAQGFVTAALIAD
ncbi:hypothetical protein SAMN06297387_13110 [Streptomyces zhaozhouensis]|uniref:Uncharacterized protein n=1 Tax=Streptomyces zhaozhouensis TaxID=1300267 RepID=A0A286E942_9ACTN|nr:hypothetical protein [Streptomyces zhaozhouensis]SOD67416.1 hypothetical protein SAMN06297387_13110 [Streptomyces zhaozhouensis]